MTVNIGMKVASGNSRDNVNCWFLVGFWLVFGWFLVGGWWLIGCCIKLLVTSRLKGMNSKSCYFGVLYSENRMTRP